MKSPYVGQEGLSPAAVEKTADTLELPAYSVRELLTTSLETLHTRSLEAEQNELSNDCPLGTPLVSPCGDEIRYLKRFAAADLKLAEHEEQIKKHSSYQNYVELAKNSVKPPYIWVNQTWTRKQDVSLNRRRTLVAQELGQEIDGWYSPISKRTGLSVKLSDVVAVYEASVVSEVPDQVALDANAGKYLREGEKALGSDIGPEEHRAILARSQSMYAEKYNLTSEQARKVLEQFCTQFPGFNGRKVYLAENSADIFAKNHFTQPPRIKAAWNHERDELLVIAGAHESEEDLRKSLQHELWIHCGIGLLPVAEQNTVINRIVESYGRHPELTEKWNQVLLENPDKTLRIQAEEVLALYAEEMTFHKSWEASIKEGVTQPHSGVDYQLTPVANETMGVSPQELSWLGLDKLVSRGNQTDVYVSDWQTAQAPAEEVARLMGELLPTYLKGEASLAGCSVDELDQDECRDELETEIREQLQSNNSRHATATMTIGDRIEAYLIHYLPGEGTRVLHRGPDGDREIYSSAEAMERDQLATLVRDHGHQLTGVEPTPDVATPDELRAVIQGLAVRASRGESPAARYLRNEFIYRCIVEIEPEDAKDIWTNIRQMPDQLTGAQASRRLYSGLSEEARHNLKSSTMETWLRGNQDQVITRSEVKNILEKVVPDIQRPANFTTFTLGG